MPNDLDRPYILNGEDLRIELSKRVFDFADDGPEASGKLSDPEAEARYVLNSIGKPYGGPPVPGRSIIRVEQLADALKGKHSFRIPGPVGMGAEHFGYLTQPGAVAESALEAITGQPHPADGSRVREMTCPNCDSVAVGHPGDHCPECGYVVTGAPAPEPCTCPVPDEKCLRGCTGEPDDGVPADVTAAGNIIRELEALSGTSGAGWDHAVNVLRFAAGHFGYELREQD